MQTRSFKTDTPKGAAYPFVPGILELCAMQAIRGPDGVWEVVTIPPQASDIGTVESGLNWKSRR